MGFTGKQVIHPGQIQVTHEAFSPSPAKIEWARGLVRAFDEHQHSGKVSQSLCIARLYHIYHISREHLPIMAR